MADAAKSNLQNFVSATGFPREDLPILLVDMLTSSSKGPGLVKLYAARIDPTIDGSGGTKVTPVAQLVMTFYTLLNTVAFLEMQVERLVEQGEISAEALDAARKTLREGMKVA